MLSFELIPDAIEKKGIELAQSTAEWELLDECTKVILSSIACNLSTFHVTDARISEAERTRLALAHQDYKKHLEAKKIAREEMLKHKAEMNGLESAFEWYRSNNANERARMRM